MARRIARSSTAAAAPKAARTKNKKRSLDAYAQAQKLVPEKGIAKHRLGEDLDDEPRQKRRKVDSEGEGDDDDDEEEEPQRKRPTKRSISDRDNDIQYGSDSDGNEWTMGGMAEDDDDSDLDSDEAFGESDEDRFEGFTFRGSSSAKSKAKKRTQAGGKRNKGGELDLNEEEASEDDSGDSEDDEGLGLGDDAVDLAAMLDDDDEEILGGNDNTARDLGEDSGSENEEDDDGYSSESDEDDDDDLLDEEAIARNRDRIEAMNAASRPASAAKPSAVVTLDDFEEDAGLGPLKTTSKSKKKQNNPTAIVAPLPKRQQDRLDREVASGKAKAELEKWLPGTKQIRRAEHLSFPLQHPDDQGVTLGKDSFLPSTQSAPQNDLEETIQRIMEESGLVAKQTKSNGDELEEESALIKAEDLAVKDMPIEEVMRRRAELRKARELLFREEIKAKRLAKIKSKSHRRVMRKQKEREREAMQALGADEMDEDDKEHADRKRAEARMSTKHRDSKWAKSLKQTNRTAWDDDARGGAIEQAQRNEELKRRIEGKDLYDEDDSDVPSDDFDEGEGTMLDKLDRLQAPQPDANKGLAGLKFMRAADERRRKANDEDVERLRRELAIADGDEAESEAEEENLGRAIFGPVGKEFKKALARPKLDFEAPEESGDEDGDEDANIVVEKPLPETTAKTVNKPILKKPSTNEASANGWLKAPEQSGKSSANGWLKAPKGKANDTDINASVDLDLRADAKKQNNPKANDANPQLTSITDPDQEEDPSDPIQKQTLQQRAFAGDDTVQTAFDIEKADLAISEDEKEISTHLPGWGSWTGEGLSRSIRKSNARAKHNPLFKTKVDGVKQADRKDANLKNVIISEKQDRKGKKYLAQTLPHEFETKEQYERSKRVPMGPEWTTKEVHQKMTKPRVVVKRGVNIKPLERPIA